MGDPRAWFRCHVLCGEDTRRIFYRIIEAQARGGTRLLTTCEMLAGMQDLEEPIQKLGHAGARAAREGLPVADGWATTDYLPPEDIGILRVAERDDSVATAASDLCDPDRTKRSFFSGVVQPSLYLMLPLVVVIAMTLGAPEYIKQLVTDEHQREGIFLYQLSLWLREFGWIILVLATGLVAVIWYGRSSWSGSQRRLLGPFANDWLAALTARYCRLASVMTSHGANHIATLQSFHDIARSAYAQSMIPIVIRDLEDGRAWPDALAGRLLTPAMADTLRGLAPDDELASYPNAFEIVGEVQMAMLDATYTKWSRWLKASVMLLIAVGLLNALYGIFAAAQTVMSKLGGTF